MSLSAMPSGATYLNYLDSRAQIKVPGARIRLASHEMPGDQESSFRQDQGYWLDFCLTPRPSNTRVCYPDHWSPHRYEPLGSVFLLPPGELLRARCDAGRQITVICVLETDQLDRWFDGAIDWTERMIDASVGIQAPAVQQLMRRLGEEVYRPSFGSDVLCEALVMQLSVELGRYYVGIGERAEAGGLPAWRLRIIDERVRDMEQPPTLAELAGLCGLSVRQLTRGFRISRGCSLGDHIAAARIEHAKRLLGEGGSVKTIAFSLGFSSPSSFCCAFRRATGQTPREHRQFAGAEGGETGWRH